MYPICGQVMYNIELQEDPVQPSILMKPTISIVGIGRVPVNRSSKYFCYVYNAQVSMCVYGKIFSMESLKNQCFSYSTGFDVSLICASVTLGIGRVSVNLSLHYANDGFNLSVFFLIEKHCTGLNL